MTTQPQCKDCEPGSKRPAPYPGPRCFTHNRAVKRERSAKAHDKRVQSTYGIPEGFYWRLYAAQGGTCAICQRATGKTKRLAVDHDHATGDVRGLCCSSCNRMLGFARDDPEMFKRAARYLLSPPAAPLLIASNNEP